MDLLQLLLILASWMNFSAGYSNSKEDELIKVKDLEVETELCFIRKVKQYCDSRIVMKDEPSMEAPNSMSSQPSALNMQPNSLSYAEDQLYEDIFRFYQKNSVAKVKGGGPVQVTVGFTLIQLNNLDEKSQVLTTSGWMEVTWDDVRLGWEHLPPYKDIQSIVVGSDRVWLPDMALQNSANDIYHSSLVDHKFRVNVYPNGSVLWIPGGKYYTNCELDISYFPFDDQTCELHFTNWAYSGAEMNLTVKEPHIGLDSYQLNGVWEIRTTTAHREDKFYACCGDTPYPSIYFTIYMRRKYLFYITNIIAPCVMLSFLVTLVFYLPPEAGEKISLSITVLLSCTVFLLLIAESIPKRSDSVPIISIYLAVFLAITTASISCTVIVIHLHHMGVHKVPKAVKLIVFDILANMICMTEISRKYGTSKCCSRDNPGQTSYSSVSASGRPSSLSAYRSPIPMHRSSNSANNRHLKTVNSGNGSLGGMRKSASITDERLTQQILVQRNYVLEELLMHIKAFSMERSDASRNEALREEWHCVARVLDRVFMLFFIISILLSSFVILIVLPMSKPVTVPQI